MAKQILTGYAVVPGSSNGKYTGKIRFSPTSLIVDGNEMVAKVQTMRGHCKEITSKEATIMPEYPGTVLRKFTKTEFEKKLCKQHK